MPKLQDMLNDLPDDRLPPAWSAFDLKSFSLHKTLWVEQSEALQNALKALWKYYEDFADYHPTELEQTTAERKRLFFEWYQNNHIEIPATFPLGKKREIASLLSDYYQVQNGEIAYQHFINRMGFWMATGSGKTLVLVKLIEFLWQLMRLGEIPINDILVLTYRDDLLKQLREHVKEFNTARSDLFIRLCELREYPEVKRANPTLFARHEVTVFYYRSDNMSDEQKEKIVDFRNYDNFGHWYILLDEAHKGDKEDSKRQQIYNILSRNGFLFNFSATFTDQRDILTTACDFNLARFIQAGYGKHISLLRQENRAFRDKEDYTDEEKQKIVLQSLLMLAYVRKAHETLKNSNGNHLYHNPLMLTLVNSVNVEDADLKLFFRQLERIGRGQVNPINWQNAKDDLRQELLTHPKWLFEEISFVPDITLFDSLTPQDILQLVFNASAEGEIEVLVRPSNNQELAFKLKSSDSPFALIKIGDISSWLKEELAGYEIVQGFEDETFFERLNAEDSDINILMGSRSFYEGWDSNRPNVITFINIGTGSEARKFILQAVGRGVRIEPISGKRKRLAPLHTAGEVESEIYNLARPFANSLESLFVFGTNRNALQAIFDHLSREQEKEEAQELVLEINAEAVDDHLLLIPQYFAANQRIIEQRDPQKFEIPGEELTLLDNYIEYLGDDRLLLAHHNLYPRDIEIIHHSLQNRNSYFNPNAGKHSGNLDVLFSRLNIHFNIIPQELNTFKPLEDEINHYKHIKVLLKDISGLTEQIQKSVNYPRLIAELKEKYDTKQIKWEKMLSETRLLQGAEHYEYDGGSIDIKRLANHYYNPVILADERANYIRHVIRAESEVRFIKAMEEYINSEENIFQNFDWWLFSKLDETLDKIYIPYYDPQTNRMRSFFPDFIFWIQKGLNYYIIFVDPKGMKISDYQHKIDGYEKLFIDSVADKPRLFDYKNYKVQIGLALYANDANLASQKYQKYWIDRPENLLSRVI